MSTQRITLLETVDGEQFQARYHVDNRNFFRLNSDIVIGCTRHSSAILVYSKSPDGVFDYIGDIQNDKENDLSTEIYIQSSGIESLKLNHSDSLGLVINNESLSNVNVKINDSEAKRFKEKKFFDF